MLGRTANGLYWMFRYIERAENSARLIDAGLRMPLSWATAGAAKPATVIAAAARSEVKNFIRSLPEC